MGSSARPFTLCALLYITGLTGKEGKEVERKCLPFTLAGNYLKLFKVRVSGPTPDM